MTSIRAYIYGIVDGQNDRLLRVDEFLAGCNRYGLDSPVPIITKRMSNYGNADEIDKDFKRILAKYKKLAPDIKKIQDIDENMHLPTDFTNTGGGSLLPSFEDATKKEKTFQFGESEGQSPGKKQQKQAGLLNMKFLESSTTKKNNLGSSEKESLVYIGGVKMKLQDIKTLPVIDEDTILSRTKKSKVA